MMLSAEGMFLSPLQQIFTGHFLPSDVAYTLGESVTITYLQHNKRQIPLPNY